MVVPGNILRVQDAKKAMQTRMALLEPGNLIILVGLLAMLGVAGARLGIPGALLGLLALLATVVPPTTVTLLMLEVHVGGAYALDNGCLDAV